MSSRVKLQTPLSQVKKNTRVEGFSSPNSSTTTSTGEKDQHRMVRIDLDIVPITTLHKVAMWTPSTEDNVDAMVVDSPIGQSVFASRGHLQHHHLHPQPETSRSRAEKHLRRSTRDCHRPNSTTVSLWHHSSSCRTSTTTSTSATAGDHR